MSDTQKTSVEHLQAWFDKEQRENGLLEMTFCPGSDRETSNEDAARVVLAMLAYEPD